MIKRTSGLAAITCFNTGTVSATSPNAENRVTKMVFPNRIILIIGRFVQYRIQ